MNKIAWIDVETTGLDKVKNGILQIACKIELGGRVIDKFVSYVKPLLTDEIAEEALKVNGITREQMVDFPLAEEVLPVFIAFLKQHVNQYDTTDKLIMGGYNTGFDAGFLREWFKKLNNKYFGSFFYWRTIDVLDHAVFYYTVTGSALPLGRGAMKLTTVSERHGLSIDNAHDAEADITMTRELFHLLNSKIIKGYVYESEG